MRRSNFFMLALIGLVMFAWVRAARFKIQSQYSVFYGGKFAVQGVILNDPEPKNGRENLEVRPDGLSQKILVTVFSGRDYEYGDQIIAVGKIAAPKPFGDFDYPDYLAAKNIYAEMFLPQVF